MGRSRSVAAIVAIGVLATALTACVGSGPAVSELLVTHTRGLPPSVTPPSGTDLTAPIAAWAGPDRIYVVVWGSGSCPRLPTTVYTDRHNDLTVKTEPQSFGADACTADLGPTTSTVDLPAGIDLNKPLRVDIDATVTTLEPR